MPNPKHQITFEYSVNSLPSYEPTCTNLKILLDLASYVRLAGSRRGVKVHEKQGELLLQLLRALPIRLQQESLIVQRQSIPNQRDNTGVHTHTHASGSQGLLE